MALIKRYFASHWKKILNKILILEITHRQDHFKYLMEILTISFKYNPSLKIVV